MLSSFDKFGTYLPFWSWHVIVDPFWIGWLKTEPCIEVLPAGQNSRLTICGLANATKFNIIPNIHPPMKITRTPISKSHTYSRHFSITFLLRKGWVDCLLQLDIPNHLTYVCLKVKKMCKTWISNLTGFGSIPRIPSDIHFANWFTPNELAHLLSVLARWDGAKSLFLPNRHRIHTP